MNLRTIGIIIRREYLNKVRKKSFLLTTLLVPILAGGGMIAMMAIMMTTKENLKKIAVVDRSSIVMPMLEDTESIDFVDYSDFCLDSVKANLGTLCLDAVLSISEIDTERRTVDADITSSKPLGMEMADFINSKIDDAVENYRIKSYGIEGLDDILKEVRTHVRLNAYTIDDEGREQVSETGVYAMFSMILGIIIMLFVTMFGGMVMSAVIEEKASRVIEVLVSSVKATELMFGKIIGIALVAGTQFVLWVVLSFGIISLAGSYFGADLMENADPAALVQGMGPSGDMTAMMTENTEISTILTTIQGMPLLKIGIFFLLFFIFGYMLYASFFAAIGSAVENEGDSQQLQMPLTIPLIVGYIIAIYAFRAPDSQSALWGSMIPLTSPIVMIARIPFGVPDWQIWLSLGILILTTAFGAWASAKIYKVGILMFGKKSTWKDLWQWFRQK